MNAIILAGGKGSRMAPLSTPKPLIPINGRPILWHIINHVKPHVEKIVVCVGYRADDVRAAIDTFKFENVLVDDAGENAPQMERVHHAAALVKRDLFVCYGDEMADVRIAAMLADIVPTKIDAVMTVMRARSEFGIADLLGNRVVRIREKPELDHYINIGYTWIRREALVKMPNHGLLSEGLDVMARDGGVYAHVHEGKRATINEIPDIERAEAELR